ncbi:MAG: 2-oxoacid:acceptor oxidoreductase family protein [Gemmatimonadota bacterium]
MSSQRRGANGRSAATQAGQPMKTGLSKVINDVFHRSHPTAPVPPKYPGVVTALDGSNAVVAMETAASEAAGAYPITPSTQMGEGWAQAVASGETNVNGRRLLFFEPEGEHAAAAVTAGMSMTGLRATNFSSGQGIVYMHESLYPAVGKRLTYVLNVAARALTKHSLNVHAGHDDYHAVDDTGFFQLFAKDVQEAADFTLIAHRIAELSLNPGISAQDGFLTSHVIETIALPERDLVREYLGDPADLIEAPTAAQRLVFGEKRRRIPELFDLDYPAMLGVVQNQESYAQGIAAQRPFYFDHISELTERALNEFAALTGRRYQRAAGYRIDDADYVLAAQGSVICTAEAVADYLREQRNLKVGVLNLSMFRPFPSDIVTRLLAGKRAVTVLERTDQPLAVDAPLLREMRAAMVKGQENARHPFALPHAGLTAVAPDQMPDFYSAGFGFGSRDLQPGDLIAAVEHMVRNQPRRQYYLGIDFIRKDTRLPKLQLWQEQLLEAYPQLDELSLQAAQAVDLTPAGAIALRIHSVGGWGAMTMGKNLALTAFELAGTLVKANPKYGSEKKGQPTTFYATLSHEPVRSNAELRNVQVVLSPDPNVFRHSDPLAGLQDGGVFVIQSDQSPADLWRSLPDAARRTIRDRGIKLYSLDGFAIASAEASDAELRYRMQGAAFMGAFFRTSSFMTSEKLDETRLFEGIHKQLEQKFGKHGKHVVDDNLRVIRRGFDEVKQFEVEIEFEFESKKAATSGSIGAIPDLLNTPDAEAGLGNPGRFWEQVCSLCKVGQDVIADPFTAISAMPAASSTFRDMSNIRFEVPDFLPEKCTGCSQCWTQCPDAAIPGLVNSVEDILESALNTAARTHPPDRLRQVSKQLAKECRKVIDLGRFTSFGDVLNTAFGQLVTKLNWDDAKRDALQRDFAAVYPLLQHFHLARTAPFYDVPESKHKGTGGLLAITINPEACKGCNICVEVCPEDALVTIKQDDAVLQRLRDNWAFWQQLPDTGDRFINISNLDEGIGTLSSLLLKKKNYRSMVGGDGACMGCGEKTTVHLIVSTIEALMQPRVAALITKLDGLITELEAKARGLMSADAPLDRAAIAGNHMQLELGKDKQASLLRILESIDALRDLRWRYDEGPGGRGRAALGMANSTGCSSVWGSTYPYNPYPFPWVNHLFQDSPSIAIGIFEGHMRKMADAFVNIRRAELLTRGEYDGARDEPFLRGFDWKQFNDDEFRLCPPIVAMGGDGAMLDIGFQNLSRLMASGKPLRVVVLDTQVYSNTGGQACTSGFTGQVADMSAYGKAQHGKQEVRKELGLIALAHRGVYVHQSSQASASHLIAGVIKGLNSRRPAVFNVYTPCPVEHGLPDEWAPQAARLALESRAFPFLTYDPDAGSTYADCLSLAGNPAIDETWPTYTLEHIDDAGAEQKLELPLTIADWAATEGRFKKHFTALKPAGAGGGEGEGEIVLFHDFVTLPVEDRADKTPFIFTIGKERKLERLRVSAEMVTLAEDRLLLWAQLRELAGLSVTDATRDRITSQIETDHTQQIAALRTDYEARLAELKTNYPRVIARRLAEGLLGVGNRNQTVAELLARAESTPGLSPVGIDVLGAGWKDAVADADAGSGRNGTAKSSTAKVAEQPASASASASPSPAPATQVLAEAPPAADDALDPYIETARCTTCNECTNLNSRMFAYNENKQAYIKDARAGTFAELVTAAERCPAGLIHPGTPLNPKEKNLEKWIKRAEAFN